MTVARTTTMTLERAISSILPQPTAAPLELRFRSLQVSQSSQESQFYAALDWLGGQSETFAAWQDPLSSSLHDWILKVLRAYQDPVAISDELQTALRDEISLLVNTILVDALNDEPLSNQSQPPHLFDGLTWHRWKFDEYERLLRSSPAADVGRLRALQTARPHEFAQSILLWVRGLPAEIAPRATAEIIPPVTASLEFAQSLLLVVRGLPDEVGAGERTMSLAPAAPSSAALDRCRLMTYRSLIGTAASKLHSRQVTRMARAGLQAVAIYEQRTRESIARHTARFRADTAAHEAKLQAKLTRIDDEHHAELGILRGRVGDAEARLSATSQALAQSQAALSQQASEIANLRQAFAQKSQQVQQMPSGGGGGGCTIL